MSKFLHNDNDSKTTELKQNCHDAFKSFLLKDKTHFVKGYRSEKYTRIVPGSVFTIL